MSEGNRHFGAYLRALRHASHKTLDDVCRLSRNEPAPLSRAVLSDLENGKAGLTLGRMITLAGIYGVRPAVLAERFGTDWELDLLDRDRIERWPTDRLMREAVRAGMSGRVQRALLLYQEAETRALEEVDHEADDLLARARLGIARALRAKGRLRLAKLLMEDLSQESLDPDARSWCLYQLAEFALTLDIKVLAEGALIALRRIPKPWPDEIEGAEQYLLARFVQGPETEDSVLDAWLRALDAAMERNVETIIGACLCSLARIERLRGRLDRAERWARELLDLAEDRQLAFQKVIGLVELALICDARRHRVQARESWFQALSLARRLQLHDLLFEIHAERWRLAVRRGDERAARAELASARRELRFLDAAPGEYRDVARVIEREARARDRRGRARRSPRTPRPV